MSRKTLLVAAAAAVFVTTVGCSVWREEPWEAENPLVPVPAPPLGVDVDWKAMPQPPTPERVRLGRWLFYDTRLSGDGSVACATCHRPEHAFSEPTPVSMGIKGQKGKRKAPPAINMASALFPHFFWDGRAASLEEQALGPIANPIEMGNTHPSMIQTLSAIQGYRPYFTEAFGSPEITKERVAHAIADYERTRMSGNAPFDRWRLDKDERAVSETAKQGHALFIGKANCQQCHVGSNFTDGRFHNIGVGWDDKTQTFRDEGRWAVTKGRPDLGNGGFGEADRGAFKTPTLREVTKRAPYMHDGSIATLREVIEFYNRGGIKNPWLDARLDPLNLAPDEVEALVEFLKTLDGEGYQDVPPKAFPQ